MWQYIPLLEQHFNVQKLTGRCIYCSQKYCFQFIFSEDKGGRQFQITGLLKTMMAHLEKQYPSPSVCGHMGY